MAHDAPLRRVPPGLIEAINRVVRVSREMQRETRREPTPEKLAARLGSPVEEVRELLRIAKAPL